MSIKPEAVENGVHVETRSRLSSGLNLSIVSPDVERHTLRRIDLALMPLIVITMGLQYVDKIILNGTAQFGIIEDLHLFENHGIDPDTSKPVISLHRFSVATLIFYWGLLVATIPASLLAQKLPIGKFLSSTVIIWGLLTVLTIEVKDYGALLALRFCLGIAEAGIGPGVSIFVTMYWKKQEQPLRYSIWYTATGLGGLLGSLMLYGMVHIEGSRPPWHYPYIILGSLTMAWGALLLVLLPDNPLTAKFLSAEQRVIAVERIRTEQTGIEDKTFKWDQALEVVTDPKSYLILAMNFCLHYVNGAISGFGTIIISSFGFSHFNAVLLTGAVGAMVVVVLIAAGAAGSYFKNSRLIIYCICEVPVIIGAALIWRMPWQTHRYAAIVGFVLLGSFAASYTMLLAIAGANTAGHTKKVLTQGIIWSTYAICNGVSPLFVKQTEVKSQYSSVFTGTIVTAVISSASCILLRFYLQHQNHKRDERYGKPTEDDIQNARFLDQTDVKNERFRYVL
ncbi:Major facilitator superfamily domain, general substrate transporter [Purpureocillium lavendulum]|uniref:Major facilitator superfamily domain, general substrate transporter n=1 Tax=Purpureocillium lavendulum TaxID=1247861 RepID=A0AB34G843_9HYPO|nr:Major facilitator superfamily domain, general substrate transporter [Purpureocillium lavendulum]